MPEMRKLTGLKPVGPCGVSELNYIFSFDIRRSAAAAAGSLSYSGRMLGLLDFQAAAMWSPSRSHIDSRARLGPFARVLLTIDELGWVDR